MGYIDLENLTKDYGQDSGVFDISLSIEQGETFGLVGINGAGKTTTIRQLMGFIKPDSGQVFINGMDTQKVVPKLNALSVMYLEKSIFQQIKPAKPF
nr:ATP-binding cassette domain-containing protein [Tetragenococcus halophilus]